MASGFEEGGMAEKQVGARRLNNVYRIMFTASGTGDMALPLGVWSMLQRTTTRLLAWTSELIDDLYINMYDDESNFTLMQMLYDRFCTEFPPADVLLGPTRASWNRAAVRTAKTYGVPIILWTFNEDWYRVGPGYDIPPNWQTAGVSRNNSTATTNLTFFSSVSPDVLNVAQRITSWVMEGDHYLEDVSTQGNSNASYAREAMDDVVANMDQSERDGYMESTHVESGGHIMQMMELAHYGPITPEEVDILHGLYRDVLGRTNSHSEFNAEMLHELSVIESFHQSLNGDLWSEDYEHTYDVNIPAKDMLYHTLATLYEEGKRTVVFTTALSSSYEAAEAFQVFIGGINCAKALNYTGVYAELYKETQHNLWVQTLDRLGADVMVFSGPWSFLTLATAEVNLYTWHTRPRAVVIAHPFVLTQYGNSLALIFSAVVSHYFIQPMPWPAIAPGAPSLAFIDMGNFLQEVFPDGDGQAEMLRAWQLSSALSLVKATLIRLQRGVDLDARTMKTALCSGQAIPTELGVIQFNCTPGSILAGMRIDRTGSTRQLFPLPTSYTGTQRLVEPQALYVSSTLPDESIMHSIQTAWWTNYESWYIQHIEMLRGIEAKRYEIWPCDAGHELVLGLEPAVAAVGNCRICSPGYYFNFQWLRCIPCTGASHASPSWRLTPGSTSCLEMPVTDPVGGAVFHDTRTVPLAAPGWYRLTDDMDEDPLFRPCPERENCLGNNTCRGSIVGAVCDSCTVGWQKWKTFDGNPFVGRTHDMCFTCDEIYPNLRIFLIASVWALLTFVLARFAAKDAWKVGAIRAACFRMLITNLQLAGISHHLIPFRSYFAFVVSEILTSPWDLLALECQAAKIWRGGTHEEWRRFVLNFRAYTVLSILAIGASLIYVVGAVGMMGKIPAESWRRIGPLQLVLFVFTGKMWKQPVVSVEEQDALAKQWSELEEDSSHIVEPTFTTSTDEDPGMTEEASMVLGLERALNHGHDDDGEEWPPPMHMALDKERFIIMHVLNDIENERTRCQQDVQRRIIAFLLVMHPIIITSSLSHFSCTSVFGVPFRILNESDLSCMASTKHRSLGKALLLQFPLVIPLLFARPLLAKRSQQGQASLHTKNQRGLSVLLTGYKGKFYLWQTWEQMRLFLFSFIAYNNGDAAMVAPRRLCFIIASAVLLAVLDPYVKSHRHALFRTAVLWHLFLGLHTATNQGSVKIFPESWHALRTILFVVEVILGALLVLRQSWLICITTWDPNRYNIDNLYMGAQMSTCQRIYMFLFKMAAGINSIVVGHGLQRAKYFDLRALTRRQTQHFTDTVADVLLESLEYQPTFCPTILYPILDEAFRRAVAGRERVIERRAIRHDTIWPGPYRKDHGFLLPWKTDPNALQRRLNKKVKLLGKRLVENKVVSNAELPAYMDTHIVVRDINGKLIKEDIRTLSRASFPLLVRIEMNRSIGVEELAIALMDVSMDFLEGEPILNAHVSSLYDTGQRAHTRQDVDDIMSHLNQKKAEANRHREAMTRSRLAIQLLFRAAGHHEAGNRVASEVQELSVAQLMADASRAGNRALNYVNKVFNHDEHQASPRPGSPRGPTAEQPSEALRDAVIRQQELAEEAEKKEAAKKKEEEAARLREQEEADVDRYGISRPVEVTYGSHGEDLFTGAEAELAFRNITNVAGLQLNDDQMTFMSQQLGALMRSQTASMFLRAVEHTEEFYSQLGSPRELTHLTQVRSDTTDVGFTRSAPIKSMQRKGIHHELHSKLAYLELLVAEYRKRGLADVPNTIKKCDALIDRCHRAHVYADSHGGSQAAPPNNFFTKASSLSNRRNSKVLSLPEEDRSEEELQIGTSKFMLSLLKNTDPRLAASGPDSEQQDGSPVPQRGTPKATQIGAPSSSASSGAAFGTATRAPPPSLFATRGALPAATTAGAVMLPPRANCVGSSQLSTIHSNNGTLSVSTEPVASTAPTASASVDLHAAVVGLQLPVTALAPVSAPKPAPSPPPHHEPEEEETATDLPMSCLAPARTPGRW